MSVQETDANVRAARNTAEMTIWEGMLDLLIATPRFGSDLRGIPLVVAMGALRPTALEMSAAVTVTTVLRSPEVRGC